jgi:hypothetical protein
MIFVLPRSFGISQGVALLAALDFVAGYLCQERTPAALADEFIDAGNHFERKDDVRSSAQIL